MRKDYRSYYKWYHSYSSVTFIRKNSSFLYFHTKVLFNEGYGAVAYGVCVTKIVLSWQENTTTMISFKIQKELLNIRQEIKN